MSTFAKLLYISLISICNGQFDPSSCGQEKGCLFYPQQCVPGSDCQISFSYRKDDTAMHMEIFGPTEGASYFLAVGFSNDREMGDDTVVFCSHVNGVAGGGLAVNSGKSNRVLTNVGNLQQIEQSTANDGNLYCKIQQQLISNNADVKNLDDMYYMLMAGGGMNGQELTYHGQKRDISPRTNMGAYYTDAQGRTTVLNDPEGSSSGESRTTKDKLKIAHGILMVLSWTIFLATGIIFARHFRGHFPDSIYLGVQLWFNLHRGLNMIGVAGTICGFVMIFVAEDWRWTGPKAYQDSEINQQWNSIHSILGLLACVVAWAQPLNAVFRCSPDQRGRIIFNMIHRFFGFGAFLMAASATMIAVVHFDSMFSNRDAALGLYIAFIAVLGLTLIALEVLSLKNWYSNRQRVGGSMEMTRVGGTSSSEISEETEKIRRLQLFIMLFFIVVAIGTAVAICVLIGLKP